MKKLLFAIVVLPTTLAFGEEYSIDWYRIAGGGGRSTGGSYSLTGTIGQPEAGDWIGSKGQLLFGGFWAVQTPGAPTLQIDPMTPEQATISWEPKLPGWILQERASLTSGSWENSPSGSTNPITVPTVGGAKFFRLSKP